jgi:GTPase
MIEIEKNQERALAVSIFKKGSIQRKTALEYLDELEFLIQTAGAFVVDKIYQELEKTNKSTLMGKGKVEEVTQIISEDKIDVLIFDNELSPAQLRNLERELNVKVIDRSGIILDIFASRAKSGEAKTQVELAQLQYLLPRLTRMWTHLSKQHGGIGTKGPGETQIETDRRLIRNRIELLKNKLIKIEKQDTQKRKSHARMTRFGLVGYTNAGKSTLMKEITGENVYIEDKLFATLDTTIRKFTLPLGQSAMLSDTVGFIRKLPTHLVASFRSTLAEARESDFLLHIVDLSHEFFRDQIKTVNETLKNLDVEMGNMILVFNKIDLLEDEDEFELIKEEFPNSIFVSATKNINIDGLRNLLQEKFDESSSEIEIHIPYEKSHLMSDVYKYSEILKREDTDFGHDLTIRIQEDFRGIFESKFSDHLVDS